jgi:hypothetical protein
MCAGSGEAFGLRVLKRRLSDVVYRRMIRDLEGAARAA